MQIDYGYDSYFYVESALMFCYYEHDQNEIKTIQQNQIILTIILLNPFSSNAKFTNSIGKALKNLQRNLNIHSNNESKMFLRKSNAKFQLFFWFLFVLKKCFLLGSLKATLG